MLRPSSRRGLTYADAVHLLGAGETPFISFLGRLAGGPAAVAGAATLSSVDLLSVRNEVVEWGQSATRWVRERQAGLSRFDRTQRLTAAHAVLVVSSLFEALDEPGSEITLAEQVALATRTAVETGREALVRVLAEIDVPMPSPAVPFETLRVELDHYYKFLMSASLTFVEGLAARIPDAAAPGHVVAAAIRRYEIGYRSLAAHVPEFAIWAAMTDASAGRATTRR